MPMPIVLMFIKFWFCCLFISRKRVKGEKGDLHNNAPSLLNHSTPFSNTYFFSFPTHTLLFFYQSHSLLTPTIIPPLSLSPTYILPFSLSNTFLLLSLPTRILRFSLPLTFPFSHSFTHTLPPLPSS